MKEIYKNDMSHIHASSELIEDTIKKVRKEKNASNYKKRRFYPYLAAGFTAAVFAIGIYTNFAMNSVVYSSLSVNVSRNQSTSTKYDDMSIDDYGSYLGIDLQSLFNEEAIEKSDIKIIQGQDEAIPSYDEATIYFSVDEKTIMMKLSKTDILAPDELLHSPISKIGKYEIHFGTDNIGNKLYAGGSLNEINYFIMGSGMEKKDFEKKIKKYFDDMKPFEN